MTRWNRTEVEALINFYEGNPFLYDNRHEDYHNRARRDKTLIEIAEKLSEIRGNKLTLVDIKSKIKTLRTQYGAEKQHMAERLRSNNITVKEEPPQESCEPKLWCYESLKFLDEFTKDRSDRTENNYSNTEEPKLKKLMIRPGKSPITEKKNVNEDVFANFVSHELKQITDSKLHYETKWKIQLALKEGIEKQMELNAEGLITEVLVE